MTVNLLTDEHLEFLSLIGDCRGLSESTLVKMPHFLKSHVAAQIVIVAVHLNQTKNAINPLNLCMLAIFSCFFVICFYFFSKSPFSKNYGGYIVFGANPVCVRFCLSVNFFFRQRFLSNYVG